MCLLPFAVQSTIKNLCRRERNGQDKRPVETCLTVGLLSAFSRDPTDAGSVEKCRPDWTQPMAGKVFLVGAGPGDPGLITLKGLECLARADLVLYDGLVNPLLLLHTR